MQQEMSREAAEEILELPPRYTKEDLRRAYTSIARKYHPDAAARHHFNIEAVQAKMVEANKANDLLRRQFADDPHRVVERGRASTGSIWEHWDEIDVDFAASDAPADKPALGVRAILLGPVVLRVLFLLWFALLWWHTFPLLPQNLALYAPAGDWTLTDVARLVAGMVYPTYLFVYEALSGYVSGFVREVLNGAVSWVTRRYVDVRSKTSSYGCSLYKLLREQVYALLMVPLVLYLAASAAHEPSMLKVALWVLTAILGVDTLAACVRGGFVNTWSSSLAERVEARYLILRSKLLQRCGAWEGSDAA